MSSLINIIILSDYNTIEPLIRMIQGCQTSIPDIKKKLSNSELSITEYLKLIKHYIQNDSLVSINDPRQRFCLIYPGVQNKEQLQASKEGVVRITCSSNHQPNLLYEYISECLCSLFEAVDSKDEILIKQEQKQIQEQITFYDKTAGNTQTYYQTHFELQIGGNEEHIRLTKLNEAKMRELFSTTDPAKDTKRAVQHEDPKVIQFKLKQRMSSHLKKITRKAIPKLFECDLKAFENAEINQIVKFKCQNDSISQ